MNVRAPSSRRIEISTGRKAAVPSGRTRPWIEHGHAVEERHHPYAVAARQEERQRPRPVGVVTHPAHVVATAVEALAGVPGPDGAEGTREPVGRGGERVAVGGHDLVRRPGDAGGVPDLVGQHLVLEGDERRGPAGEDRPAEDGPVGGHERPPDPGGAALGVEGLDRRHRVLGEVSGEVVEDAHLLGHVGRGGSVHVDHHAVAVGRLGPGPVRGGEHEGGPPDLAHPRDELGARREDPRPEDGRPAGVPRHQPFGEVGADLRVGQVHPVTLVSRPHRGD